MMAFLQANYPESLPRTRALLQDEETGKSIVAGIK
jgi:hypothetical protein